MQLLKLKEILISRVKSNGANEVLRFCGQSSKRDEIKPVDHGVKVQNIMKLDKVYK